MQEEAAVPQKTLSLIDGAALIVGVVVGTGIGATAGLALFFAGALFLAAARAQQRKS